MYISCMEHFIIRAKFTNLISFKMIKVARERHLFSHQHFSSSYGYGNYRELERDTLVVELARPHCGGNPCLTTTGKKRTEARI